MRHTKSKLHYVYDQLLTKFHMYILPVLFVAVRLKTCYKFRADAMLLEPGERNEYQD
jgi:hypothetical protein